MTAPSHRLGRPTVGDKPVNYICVQHHTIALATQDDPALANQDYMAVVISTNIHCAAAMLAPHFMW